MSVATQMPSRILRGAIVGSPRNGSSRSRLARAWPRIARASASPGCLDRKPHRQRPARLSPGRSHSARGLTGGTLWAHGHLRPAVMDRSLPPGSGGLGAVGATLGATRTNDLSPLRTYANSRQ